MSLPEFLQNPWIVGTGVTVLGGIILYYIFGVGRDKSKQQINKGIKAGVDVTAGGDIIVGGSKVENSYANTEETKRVDIRAYHKRIEHTVVIELVNIGNIALVDMEVLISWEQEDGKHDRVINSFLQKGADIVMSHPSTESIIEPGEKIWAMNIPHHSKSDQIILKIEGKNAHTDEHYEKTFTLDSVNDKYIPFDITWI